MDRKALDQLGDPRWFRLDNAGKIFAPILTKRYTTMLRVGVGLTCSIDPEVLQQAVNLMMDRCPYYQVQLRRGLFWYYLQELKTYPPVEKDSCYPCRYIPLKKRGQLPLRVLYFNNQVHVEFSHFLTDGTGALNFLLGVVREYLVLQGIDVGDTGSVLRCDDEPLDPKEFEDSFLQYYTPNLPKPLKRDKAFHFSKAGRIPKKQYLVTHGFVETATLKSVAKTYGATIGAFLTAVLLFSLQDLTKYEKKQKPLRIDIPINLRKLYPSKTMRNFVLNVMPEIDPRLGWYKFEEIVDRVQRYMRNEIDHRSLKQQICRNVEAESSLYIRVLPRFLKDIILKRAYRSLGHRAITMTLSNLGDIKVDGPMGEYMSMATFVFPPSDLIKGCTVSTCGNLTNIAFGSMSHSKDLEKIFYRKLVSLGIPVKISEN